MKTSQMIAILTLFAAVTTFSCSRTEPPVVAEQPPAAALEPVRESAWKPAPAHSIAPKTAQRPAQAPVAVAPVPVRQETPAARVNTPPPPPPPQPIKVTLEAGSVLAVRVGESLSSEKNESGDSWSGVLAEPLVINGLVIANRGSVVQGRVTDVKRAGRVKGVASLSIALTRFETADGQRIAIETSSFSAAGKDETKKDVGKVAIASGIGAAIGAIAGGGKGAAIGAGAGGAAGTGTVLVMRGGPAVIATEALINFRTRDAVIITEKLK